MTGEARFLLPVEAHGSYGAAVQAAGEAQSKLLTDWQAFYHVVSFLSGSGMLYLPLALVEIDWYGMLLLAAAAAVSGFCCKLLVDALAIVRWSSGESVWFGDLADECFGRSGRFATAMMVNLCFLLLATGQLTLAASCINGVTGLHPGTALVLVTVCLWFQVFVPSLKELTAISAFNVGLSFWIESVILGDAMYPLKDIAVDKPEFVFVTPDLSDTPLFQRVAYIFGLVLSCVFCHTLVPTIYNAMRNHHHCTTVVTRGILAITALLYLPVCSVTYAVYGPTLQAPVFFNMRNVVVRTLAITLYAVHLLLSFTTTIYPLQRALEDWLVNMSCDSVPGISGLSSPRRSGDQFEDNVEATVRVISRTMLILATALLSFFFAPNVVDVFAWMLVPMVFVSMLLPSAFYWKICNEEAGCLDKLAVLLISSLGVILIVGAMGVIVRTYDEQ